VCCSGEALSQLFHPIGRMGIICVAPRLFKMCLAAVSFLGGCCLCLPASSTSAQCTLSSNHAAVPESRLRLTQPVPLLTCTALTSCWCICRCIAEDKECLDLLTELGAAKPTLHQWSEYSTTAARKDTHIWSNLPLRSCRGPKQPDMRASMMRLRRLDAFVERYAVEVS
jgi:hypothetical protein